MYIDKELLIQIKEYIEKWEHEKDNEWGDCRSLEKIIQDGDMPELYNRICKLING
jgi:hypothetical protein